MPAVPRTLRDVRIGSVPAWAACRRPLPSAGAGRSGPAGSPSSAAVIVTRLGRRAQPALPGEPLRDNPVRRPTAICYVRVVKVTGVRARVVALIAVSALLAGVAASAFGSYDSGITWL